MIYRTRFAPSPTGYLHLGHAYSALRAFEAAGDHKGEMVLRLEDIDHTRCRPVFESAIIEDLSWLGLTWPNPVLRQSDHLSDYRKALQKLLGLPTPVYCHHPLLLDDQGLRLAKRKGSKALLDYRLEQKKAVEIKDMIATAPKL